jgi:MSHA pilin protein MshA
MKRNNLKNLSSNSGFSLTELIVVIVILGILAASALPRFISLGNEARVSSINALAGSIRAAANMVYLKCSVSSNCDETKQGQNITLDGVNYQMHYGFPDAGDSLNLNQIDTVINYSGFTASLLNAGTTRFSLANSPDPTNCAIDYVDAYHTGTILVLTYTTGC